MQAIAHQTDRAENALGATSCARAMPRVATVPPPCYGWPMRSVHELGLRQARARAPRCGLGRGAERHAVRTRVPAAPSVRPPRAHAEGHRTVASMAPYAISSCLILLIPDNMINGTNHTVYHVFVDTSRSHGCKNIICQLRR
jgi:hypothetical protein